MEHKIREAMGHLNPVLVQEAAQPMTRRRKRGLRPMLIAACLAVLCVISVAAVSGDLLVQFYHNGNLPDWIAKDQTDAYYEVSGNEKIPMDRLPDELLALAAKQGPGGKVYPFADLMEIAEFLGMDFPSNSILEEAKPVSIQMTDTANQVIHDSPGSVLLFNDTEGRLILVKADYYCRTANGRKVLVTASAATERNPSGSVGSLGVDYEGGEVLQQKAETYLTASGRECTIVSTQNSLTEGWDVYSWVMEDGFVLSLSLDSPDEGQARAELKQILDGFQ